MSEEQVAWTAMPYRAPVLDATGNQIGTAESLLGDEAEDIFHGIMAKLAHNGEMAEIAASRVTRITKANVHTDLQPDDVDNLPPYHQSKWYHLEWGGLFRKRPEWKETDEA